MKRRWKVGIALAVLGITAFLVWAFLSPVKPPLSVRFYGYRTNTTLPSGGELLSQDRHVFAVFAVTNNTSRVIVVGINNVVRIGPGELGYLSPWVDVTNYHPGPGQDFPLFKPGKGALAELRVYRTDKPIQILVEAVPYWPRPTIWSRFFAWLSRNDPPYSATATSEPR